MLCFLLFSLVFSREPFLVPYPAHLEMFDGYWTLPEDAQIYYDSSVDGAKEVAEMCAAQLRKSTGYALPLTTTDTNRGILFSKGNQPTDDEEYDITVNANWVRIEASKRSGLFYGYQTLLQLLPVEVFCDTVQYALWRAPCLTIHDYPRFSWRGILVDVCRHYFDMNAVKSIIDGMAISKLNTIHMHLTDDQGWRIEIKKYPLLTQIGSVRDESPKMWDRDHTDGTKYGPYFYTQDQMKELVAYAKARGITIVPEIEMPGHSLAALSGYPQYSCTGGPFKPRCIWGVEEDVYCAGNDETFTFIQNILDEVFEIFNSTFIHCGGDECPKTRWQTCSKCQQRIKEQGLSGVDQLQSWFVQQMANYVASKGKRLIGWDEILQGGLPDGTAVMSWRGVSGGQQAALLGHDVVMTPAYYLYLDYYQFPITEHYEYNALLSTLNRIYEYDPRSGISAEYQKYIIGVQGNAWAEFIWHMDDLQYKIFPRSCAVGETGWTQLENKNWARFATNVELAHLQRLRYLKLNTAPISCQPYCGWRRNEISSTEWTTKKFVVSGALEQTGSYGVIFMFTEGKNALKIKNVKLLVNAAQVASDDHEGTAFDPSENNTWSFYVATAPAVGAHIEVQADVMTVDGEDSNGKVFIYCK